MVLIARPEIVFHPEGKLRNFGVYKSPGCTQSNYDFWNRLLSVVFLFMVALCNRETIYIFILFLLHSFFFLLA